MRTKRIILLILAYVYSASILSQSNDSLKFSGQSLNQKLPKTIDKQFSVTQWLEDLDFVVASLKKIHPNIYSKISSEDFEKIVESARLTIYQSNSDIESYIAIRKVVASIKDAHTLLRYSGTVNLSENKLPVKMEYFTDGVYISAVDEKDKALLDLKVIAIDGMPIEDVIFKILEITNGDNEFGQKKQYKICTQIFNHLKWPWNLQE